MKLLGQVPDDGTAGRRVGIHGDHPFEQRARMGAARGAQHGGGRRGEERALVVGGHDGQRRLDRHQGDVGRAVPEDEVDVLDRGLLVAEALEGTPEPDQGPFQVA